MNKLIPFTQFSKKAKKFSFLSNTSVVVDKESIPVGFVFGREAFISFLETIDNEFDEKVEDPHKAYNNVAGKLIDLIEEKLPLNPEFVKKVKAATKNKKKEEWISLEELSHMLHV